MNDEQLTRMFQVLDEAAEPDATFADTLLDRLQAVAPVSPSRRPATLWAFIAAALLVAAAIGGALAVGGGLIKLPFVMHVPSPEPSSTTSATAPSRARLAYWLRGDIYLADWDGANPVRIADGPAGGGCDDYYAEGPMWSPDGLYLAYRSGCWSDSPGHPPETVTGMVHISDARGRPVASMPGEGWRVAWSHDSTRVATWDNFEETIFIYGVDGERQAHIALPPAVMRKVQLGDYDPVWSPDGASLLLPPFVVPIDGSEITRLTADDPLSHYESSLSPDGAQIAFSAGNSLSVAGTDGSRVLWPTTIAPAVRFGPRWIAWSPAGDRIAFVAQVSGEDSSLRMVDVASGTVRVLFRTTAPTDVIQRTLAWSPEGDRILFGRYNAENQSQSLWAINVDGSNAARLIDGTGQGDWQPTLR